MQESLSLQEPHLTDTFWGEAGQRQRTSHDLEEAGGESPEPCKWKESTAWWSDKLLGAFKKKTLWTWLELVHSFQSPLAVLVETEELTWKKQLNSSTLESVARGCLQFIFSKVKQTKHKQWKQTLIEYKVKLVHFTEQVDLKYLATLTAF